MVTSIFLPNTTFCLDHGSHDENVHEASHMKKIKWNQDFVTTMESIDDEHQTLVQLINKLSEAIYAGDGNTENALLHSYEQLTAYIDYHFSHELHLMRKEHMDARHIDFHQLQHAQFYRQLSSLWATIHSTSNPADTFLEFLTSWLAIHILGVDQLMSRQIELIRSGHPPEIAYEAVTDSESGDSRVKVILNGANALYRVSSHLNLQLEAANTDLENRVGRRTEELRRVNRELTSSNQKLAMLSNIDGLLQIANRRHFDNHLTQECARAFRGKKHLGLLMIDVDFFKLYNDTYGHLEGDTCLQTVARVISSTTQRPSDFVARYGGEELVVLLPETDMDGVRTSAQRICDAIAAMEIPHSTSSIAPFVTVSVGAVSMVPTTKVFSMPLIEAADKALYAAKKAGRNQIALA